MDGTAGEGSTQEATEVKVEPRIIEVGSVRESTETKQEPADTSKAVTGSEEGSAAPAAGEETEGRKGKALQDRIDEITRARREAEREAEYWKARAGAGDKQAQQPKDDPDARPRREDFQSDAEHVEALTDWKVTKALSDRDAKQAESKQIETKATAWNDKLVSARNDIADFNAVVNAVETPVAPHVADALMEHEHGAKVVYDLAKDPEVLEKLNGMTPTKAAFQIAKLASVHDKAPETAQVAPSSKPVAVSKAPPPAGKQVGAGRATAPKPEDMSQEDYVAWRKQNGASWSR